MQQSTQRGTNTVEKTLKNYVAPLEGTCETEAPDTRKSQTDAGERPEKEQEESTWHTQGNIKRDWHS